MKFPVFKKSFKNPLYKQLYNFLLEEITSGRLGDGERIPARREMSEKLKLSTTTVNIAYQTLTDDGYLVSRPNKGFFVNSSPAPIKYSFDDGGWANLRTFKHQFSYNGIDTTHIDSRAFNMSVKKVMYYGDDFFNHGEKQGEYALCHAISRHLYSARGIDVRSDQVLIGCGCYYLIGEVCKALGPETMYGVTNPFELKVYTALKGLNARIKLINVGMNGLDVNRLEKSGTDIVAVMPECDCPTGHRMTLSQRYDLLAWVNAKESRYIIENAADWHLIYGGEPIQSLYSLNNGKKVIYMNSFERSLAPSIKTAYFVLPEELLNLFKRRLTTYNSLVSRFEQQVHAEFINGGYFSKHLHKMNGIYRDKRDYLQSVLLASSIGNRMTITADSGGTHFLGHFESSADERELVAAAADADIKILNITAVPYLPNSAMPDKTFIFGYGGLTKKEMDESVLLLSKTWSKM